MIIIKNILQNVYITKILSLPACVIREPTNNPMGVRGFSSSIFTTEQGETPEKWLPDHFQVNRDFWDWITSLCQHTVFKKIDTLIKNITHHVCSNCDWFTPSPSHVSTRWPVLRICPSGWFPLTLNEGVQWRFCARDSEKYALWIERILLTGHR